MLHETSAPSLLPSDPGPPVDDQGLICRVAARDHDAFEQLYQRYARRLRGYLQRLLPPQVLPEDVLSEVMLLVWHHAARCDPSKPLVAWLFGIARHKAQEARRAVSRWHTPTPASSGESAADALEVGVAQHEITRAVLQALTALPPSERQVMELTYYHDLSYPEIAALVGCPVNTVKARMARARRRLEPQLNALVLVVL